MHTACISFGYRVSIELGDILLVDWGEVCGSDRAERLWIKAIKSAAKAQVFEGYYVLRKDKAEVPPFSNVEADNLVVNRMRAHSAVALALAL